MDVIVIGGGPAGLFAAEILAKAGKKVAVYDRKASVGRKFLMAGRGGLNLTHSEPINSFTEKYNGAESFLAPLLQSFSPGDLRSWCEGLGQETFVGSSGRVFPKTMKASPLLRAWLQRLETLGVRFHMQRTWLGWDENAALVFQTPDGAYESITPKATLLALGGASWPNLGSDGAWADLLKNSGVAVAPLKPSNCGFITKWSDVLRERHAGEPLKNITLSLGDKTVAGEIIISDKGIEGGAVYALSSDIRDSIEKTGKATVLIDLRPNQLRQDLIARFLKPRARQSFSTYLQKILGLSSLHTTLLREAAMDVQTMPPEQVAALVKALPITLAAPFSVERAISSAGGIKLDAIDRNLMVKNLPGIFAAGEMLDWEAPTGGYLLQATFATAHAAAYGIMNWMKS